ncbi:MAG: signal recognition particle protein [Coriobacteriia bacterium]
MFENLSERLQQIARNLTGRGHLREADVDEAMREIRLALLEADVNFRVVKDFIARVRERAIGEEVLRSLTPGQVVIKIVHDELASLMGATDSRLTLSNRMPAVVMLVGLQGSGKTTAAAKLALHLRKQGRTPMLIACDLYRPAAIDQLETLGRELDVPVFRGESDDPVQVASQGIKAAVSHANDVAIVDTAGRLHVDEEMMAEAACIKDAVKPDQVLLVVDAMTGQDAVNVAQAFAEKVDFDGVIMTKLDGDARGGAALSIRAVTGKPIKFVGVGERPDAFEVFHPKRMADRILGMGDVVTLVEKAQEAYEEEQARKLEEKVRTADIDLDDFLDQVHQLKKMGGLEQILAMLPGKQTKALRGLTLDDSALDRTAAIIQSMTPAERAKPAIINGSRRERIARGAGVTVFEVNQLLKQFAQMKRMMKQMSTATGKRRRGGFPGFPM